MKYNEKYLMKDFYDRTFSILDQYNESKENLGENSYEVTLLINCLFGIIIMPRTYLFKKLKNKKFKKDISKIILTEFGEKKSLENYELEKLFGNLRNSLAHWGDSREDGENLIFEDKNDKISGLKIINKYESNSFEIYFENIDSIREFLKELKEIIDTCY